MQIKNNKTISMYFFNGQKYDNSIILQSICDIYKNNVTLNVIRNSYEFFKMIDFKFKKIKYSLKLLDMCNFIKGSLNDLSENLNDKNKIITREHFPDNFELMKYKACSPYEFITKENIYNENLPSIEKFYSSLKLDNISEEDYDKTLEIYKSLNCKNIKGDYKVLYMDTNSIYAKLNISYDEYLKVLEKIKICWVIILVKTKQNVLIILLKNLLHYHLNVYSYICKNDIEKNKDKLKNDIVHSKGIANSYKNKYIDHALFKKILIENMKHEKISFNNISVKNQQIKTNTIIKNNIDFLNDKRYISDINENVPHTLYIE